MVSGDVFVCLFRPEHTLYLQVSAPATRPSLILAKGQSRVIDFGKIGTGDVSTHTVQVLNISSQPIKLQSSLLDPCGPFQLRNALRNIRPEESHDLILWFCPHIGGKVGTCPPHACDMSPHVHDMEITCPHADI